MVANCVVDEPSVDETYSHRYAAVQVGYVDIVPRQKLLIALMSPMAICHCVVTADSLCESQVLSKEIRKCMHGKKVTMRRSLDKTIIMSLNLV